MKYLALVVVALCASLLAPQHAEASRNIVFISIDDMRNHQQAITPNLDALAANSTVYTNAYATAVWCLPSRTTSLFGISPGNHRIGLYSLTGNPSTPEYQAVYNNPAVLSLPEMFSAQGYTTATTGKIFHIPQSDRWDINGPAETYDTAQLTFEGPLSTFIKRGVFPAHLTHPDQVSADWAVSFLQGPVSQQAPFFLAIGFNLPHLPLIPPQSAYDLYNGVTITPYTPVPGDLNDLPLIALERYTEQVLFEGEPFETTLHQLVVDTNEAEPITLAYLASISHTDAMIGLVLNALANSPHAANTDVIIWSDHGYQLGEKFRWGKRSFHEGSARAPLIIQAGAITPGTVTTPVSLLDLAPTAIDLGFGGTSTQFDGVSLVSGASLPRVYHEDGVAEINGNMKVIDYNEAVVSPYHLETYDLAADSEELTNLTPPPGC